MYMDVKDKRILEELSSDCRLSVTRIAKSAGISREVADYRIKRLLKSGIISAFCADISLEELGYTKNVVYLEINSAGKSMEEQIIERLAENKLVGWLTASAGKWSFIFDIYSRNTTHLGSLLRELRQSLGKNLGKYEVVTLERCHYFRSKFFSKTINAKEIRINSYGIDETDLLIMSLLRNNARLDCVSLSKKAKITPEAVSRRIKLLKASGIITSFYIVSDISKFGFTHYNIQVNLENTTEEKERKLGGYLRQHASVSFVHYPISALVVEFGVFVKDPGELRSFIQELRNSFPEMIKIKDISLFYEEITGNFLPEGVFTSKAA